MSILDKFKKQAPTNPKAQKSKASSSNKTTKEVKELSVAELEVVEAKKSVVSKEPKVVKATKKEDTKNAYRILVKPLITEKGTYLNSQGKYLFKVALNANKVEIKKAIYNLYNVWPTKINIVRSAGKNVTFGRTRGKTSDWKKAIITVPQGTTLSVYEGV